DLSDAQRLLDIGSGTGLLALMCKQRKPSLLIDAVEIDHGAAVDAKNNIAQSPWPDITLFEGTIQDYQSGQPYDVIISNPPYFNHSLKGDNRARNLARHTDELSFTELLEAFKRLSHNKSRLHVILPCKEAEEFIAIAKQSQVYLQRRCKVKTTLKKSATRSLMTLGYAQLDCVESALCIYNEMNEYSQDYTKLCRDFYLKMRG
ncbi:MAG: tRNA1(Val) (adenine(37)-N6)-methyltransferase, partial [Pseudoalteromonas sp.]